MNKIDFYYRLQPVKEDFFVSLMHYYSDRWVSKSGKKIGMTGWEISEIEKKNTQKSKLEIYHLLVSRMIKALSGRIGIKGHAGYFYIPNAVIEFKKALKKHNEKQGRNETIHNN